MKVGVANCTSKNVNITSPITSVRSQVLVESEDPQMTLGLVNLQAKDAEGDAAGTVTYDLVADG